MVAVTARSIERLCGEKSLQGFSFFLILYQAWFQIYLMIWNLTYEFYYEELDNYLVPEEHLEKLPNPLIFETLSYVDENRNEWIIKQIH
jgi:hypothetical protein